MPVWATASFRKGTFSLKVFECSREGNISKFIFWLFQIQRQNFYLTFPIFEWVYHKTLVPSFYSVFWLEVRRRIWLLFFPFYINYFICRPFLSKTLHFDQTIQLSLKFFQLLHSVYNSEQTTVAANTFFHVPELWAMIELFNLRVALDIYMYKIQVNMWEGCRQRRFTGVYCGAAYTEPRMGSRRNSDYIISLTEGNACVWIPDVRFHFKWKTQARWWNTDVIQTSRT